MKNLKVIITGVTGMIGEGVLHESLQNPNIEKVLAITRKTSGYNHSKLTEIIHNDLADISTLTESIKGYDACYFCVGITSMGKSEAEYNKLTYDLTLGFAKTLAALNPEMTFCYISGTGTDSSEKGRSMWARVKGKTENDLMKLSFKQVYNFRPGGIEPFLALRPTQTYYKTYKYAKGLFWLMKKVAPNYVITLKDLANAMINASLIGYSKNILEMSDMKVLAKTKL